MVQHKLNPTKKWCDNGFIRMPLNRDNFGTGFKLKIVLRAWVGTESNTSNVYSSFVKLGFLRKKCIV